MPDAGSQLAEYFEAATERIDADDVFAAAAVQRQLREHRAPQRRVRPAWALAAGFLGVVVLVGGVMLSTWLAQRPDSVEPATFSAPVSEASGSWDWWPLAVVGGLVIAGTGFVLFLRRRRATKEVEMKTLEERQREAMEATPRRTRRPWIIGAAIVLIVAGGLAAWAITEGNQKSDIEIATEFAEAWERGDAAELVTFFAEDVTFRDYLGQSRAGRDAVAEHLSAENLAGWGLRDPITGDVTDASDGTFLFTTASTWEGDGDVWISDVEITIDEGLVATIHVTTARPAE